MDLQKINLSNEQATHRLRTMNPYQLVNKKRIADGRDHYQMVLGQRNATWFDFVKGTLDRMFVGEIYKLIVKPCTGEPVYARVEANRWLADCECGGAEVVDQETKRFFCFSCLNVNNGGRARPVIFPADQVDIEDNLLARDMPMLRNYTPAEAVTQQPQLLQRGFLPETIKTLVAENKAAGLSPVAKTAGR